MLNHKVVDKYAFMCEHMVVSMIFGRFRLRNILCAKKCTPAGRAGALAYTFGEGAGIVES